MGAGPQPAGTGGNGEMAKRLTDTDKWKRKNYRLLPPLMKLAHQYLLDNCDHCGIWHPDFDLMSFQIGAEITEEEFFEHFGKKCVLLPNGAIFYPTFLSFQYKGKLNPKNKAHQSVIDTIRHFGLEKHSPPILESKPLPSPLEAPSKGESQPLSRGQGEGEDSGEGKGEGSGKGEEAETQKPQPTEDEEPPFVLAATPKPGDATGAIEELQTIAGHEFLSQVTQRAQKSWLKVFGIELVTRQLPLALAKWQTDDHRSAQGGLPLYLNSWLTKEFNKGPAPPPHADPGLKQIVYYRDGEHVVSVSRGFILDWAKKHQAGRAKRPPPRTYDRFEDVPREAS